MLVEFPNLPENAIDPSWMLRPASRQCAEHAAPGEVLTGYLRVCGSVAPAALFGLDFELTLLPLRLESRSVIFAAVPHVDLARSRLLDLDLEARLRDGGYQIHAVAVGSDRGRTADQGVGGDFLLG